MHLKDQNQQNGSRSLYVDIHVDSNCNIFIVVNKNEYDKLFPGIKISTSFADWLFLTFKSRIFVLNMQLTKLYSKFPIDLFW